MASNNVDYAQLYEIHSVAGAVVFAIAYAPLLGYCLFQVLRERSSEYFFLVLFCLARILSFSFRAALASSSTVAHNSSFLIASEVTYYIGFFGLIFSAFTLALDRESLMGPLPLIKRLENIMQGPLGIFWHILRNRHLIHIMLITAVILGIIGVTDATSSDQSKMNTGHTLRSANIYIYLAVVVLLNINVVMFICAKALYPPSLDLYQTWSTDGGALSWIGRTYDAPILLLISMLLLAHEAFYAATVNNFIKQNNENFWYPLSALTEFIAATLFVVPGLIPARSELKKRHNQEEIGLE
ncbi:hypothetical protein AcW1_003844 [Taiwanofungus camphoratus]|nr:hypothetical protein AcW1_003844 [Antrodia cinnamomea]